MSVVQDRFPKRTIEHVTLPEERPERRGLDRGSVGARADLRQIPAAGPDPGTARPDANPQATDPGDRTAHTTPAEDVRGREREADPRDHRHPGRQRSGDPDGAHPGGRVVKTPRPFWTSPTEICQTARRREMRFDSGVTLMLKSYGGKARWRT